MSKFNVGLTRDFLVPSGELAMGDIGLEALKNSGAISVHFFKDHHAEVPPGQIAGYDAVIALSPRFSAKTLSNADSRLSVLARFGVGYDMVDVGALTDRNAILTVTPDGVRRPMASGIVGFILALSLNIPSKIRLIREGQ